MKTLTPYYGGKASSIGKYIASLLPAHRIYVEPCGGMAGVLMQKSPSFQEVYNDIDGNIVNLFRVVRDPQQCAQLIRRLDLTPYARDEWRYCINGYKNESDPIEWARMVYTVLSSSYIGSLRNSGFAFGGVKNESCAARNFANSITRSPAIAKRFKNIIIENQPALEVCERWDSPGTLIYLDPPYLPETRKTLYDYKVEMNYADHEALLKWCLQAKSKIVLSGYASKLYKQLDKAGWLRIDKPVKCHLVAMSGADAMTRTESLWFSPNALTQINHNLFTNHG